jgi:FkbM family methyltransferase
MCNTENLKNVDITYNWYDNLKLAICKKLIRIRPTILLEILKSFLNIKRLTINCPDGLFWIDPISHLGIKLSKDGLYEKDTGNLLKRILKEGDTFVDVGANEGYFTVMGAKLVGATGKVIAIEPQERLIDIITENLRLNNVQNSTVLNLACSTSNISTATIYLFPTIDTGPSSLVRKYRFSGKKQQVICKSLDYIFTYDIPLGKIDLIKIDVEGYEQEVLEGAKYFLENHRIKYILVDYHLSILDNRGIDPSNINGYLESYGYNTIDAKFNRSGYNLYTFMSCANK